MLTPCQKESLSHKEPIEICFCIDRNYVSQLKVVFLSLKDSNSHNIVNINVIENTLSDHDKDSLKKIFHDFPNINVKFYNGITNDVVNLEAGGHISSATYIRFEIPEVLIHVDKVLYLDADLLVVDDLYDFWSVDVADYYVAAVTNPFFDRFNELLINKDFGYFNAGVLLINNLMWKKKGVKGHAINFLRKFKGKAIMFDQDALNYVFEGNWKKVDVRWNLQTSYLRFRNKISDKALDRAIERPGIIHFSSSSKPWHFLDPHPMTWKFIQYESEINEKIERAFSFRSIIKYIGVRLIFLYQLKGLNAK